MKKWIAVLLIVASLLSLTGCKKGDCDLCGDKDVRVKDAEILGQSAEICYDCAEEIEELKEKF